MKRLILWLFTLIGILVTVAAIGLEIYVWLTYATAPAGEIPAWALILMFKG
ncbi:MAG: hypothetical protein K2L67_06880 [Clostridia bacterium]|nr:hypothetical protein [Clostridia bacterium]